MAAVAPEKSEEMERMVAPPIVANLTFGGIMYTQGGVGMLCSPMGMISLQKCIQACLCPDAIQAAFAYTDGTYKEGFQVDTKPAGCCGGPHFTVSLKDYTQVEDQPTTLGRWYDTCVGHGAKFPFRPRDSAVSWRDDQVYHIMCILERKLALGESTFSALQIGANDGKDAFYDALVYARRHYGDVDVRATLVEPTLHNFDKLKAHYGASETVGQIVEYVNGAVCDSCCAPDGTTQIFQRPKRCSRAFDRENDCYRRAR